MEAIIPTLVIRADSTTQIGTGHIMRCIALAQAWQDQGGEITFISHCKSDGLRQRIIDEGFSFIPIEYPHPDPNDLCQTLAFLKQPSAFSFEPLPAWLVLDGYHFTASYQKAIIDAGIHLLVIDDMNHLPHYHADILLNQNIHAPELKYNCDAETTIFRGTQYVLLRREFLKYRNFKRQVPDRAKNILVTLGGGDPDNVTLKVIQALNLIGDPNIEVKIVVGPANQNIERLKKELALSPFTFHLSPNANNMPELMAWADLAISAGGSTCWELAFMGVPIVVLILADNQKAVAEGISKEGFAVNLGWYKTFDENITSEEINALIQSKDRRSNMIQKSQAYISTSCKNHLCEGLLTTLITI